VSRVLAIGEAPGPRPSEVALAEYERRIPGISQMEIVKVLDYWPGRSGKGSAFPRQEARERAQVIWDEHPLKRRFLFIGIRTAQSFRIWAPDIAEWFDHRGRRVAVLPHPSGVNTIWWNQPENREMVREFMGTVRV